jgi:hypothetical protein
MKMFKTRVKFRVKGTDILKIGYLMKDKHYEGGCYVVTLDKKERTAVFYLDIIERI